MYPEKIGIGHERGKKSVVFFNEGVNLTRGAASFVFYIFAETFLIINGILLDVSLPVAYEVERTILVLGIQVFTCGRINTRRISFISKTVYAEFPPGVTKRAERCGTDSNKWTLDLKATKGSDYFALDTPRAPKA